MTSWPTSSPYLILHKVRGEPAFDIAVQMEVEGEVWWIIPTSGHRAYPAKWWELDDLRDTSDINGYGFHERPTAHDSDDLSDLPDHYAHNDRSHTPTQTTTDILALIGAAKPQQAIGRRR